MLSGTDNIPWNIRIYIPHIQFEYGEYFMENYQSHKTMLWVWLMLWAKFTCLKLFYKF